MLAATTRRASGEQNTRRVRRAPHMNQDEQTLPAFIIVSREDIAARAYQFYLQRGAAHGFDRDDWLRAEEELKPSPRTS